MVVPHFLTTVQIVWKETTEVGCARDGCFFESGGDRFDATYLVCRYNPPGNTIGRFNENVRATAIPEPDASSCNVSWLQAKARSAVE